MGGRGSSSGMPGGGSGFPVNTLNDSTNFNEFIRSNMSNPEFKKFGQENSMDDVRQLWYEKRASVELENVHEMDIGDAVDQVRDAIPSNVSAGWFRNADSDYKPKLMDAVMSNPGTLNAGMNIAYNNYKNSTNNPQPFDKWVRTPQTMYRGSTGQSTVGNDIFMSYTPDKSVANKFGGNTLTIRVRPIDTWGSYQTTAEQEFLIPVRRRR